MCNRFFLLAMGVILVLGISPARAETAFFQSLPDVPVAAGLLALPNQAVVFDKPGGRIAEVVAVFPAHGDHAGAGGVVQFYEQVLPALGWHLSGAQSYLRGQETLRYWFEEQGKETYFHILVEPANGL